MRQNFYDELSNTDLKGLAERSRRASPADVDRVLAAGGACTLEDFAVLISPAALARLEDMAQISASLTEGVFGRTMRMFAPLYVSNECVNNCKYCGFACRHKIDRKTLSLEEVEREVEAIYKLGFRTLLLVAAENPKLVSTGYMGECIKIAIKRMPSVSIEIAPSSVEDYRTYVDLGCEGLTVFQETYDEAVYPSLHPSGPKADFKWRLGTPERGADGGMRKLGLGPLLGLNEWRFEILAVALHACFLEKRAWKSQVSISLPRMRPAASGFIPKEGDIPNDKELVQITCALRMFLPRVSLVVSTRESRKMRDGLMRIGATQMSAFSSTQPGGYADLTKEGEQFHIDDNRTPEEFARALRERGIDPVWKDFDASLAGRR